jgi:hypothetical protein
MGRPLAASSLICQGAAARPECFLTKGNEANEGGEAPVGLSSPVDRALRARLFGKPQRAQRTQKGFP